MSRCHCETRSTSWPVTRHAKTSCIVYDVIAISISEIVHKVQHENKKEVTDRQTDRHENHSGHFLGHVTSNALATSLILIEVMEGTNRRG